MPGRPSSVNPQSPATHLPEVGRQPPSTCALRPGVWPEVPATPTPLALAAKQDVQQRAAHFTCRDWPSPSRTVLGFPRLCDARCPHHSFPPMRLLCALNYSTSQEEGGAGEGPRGNTGGPARRPRLDTHESPSLGMFVGKSGVGWGRGAGCPRLRTPSRVGPSGWRLRRRLWGLSFPMKLFLCPKCLWESQGEARRQENRETLIPGERDRLLREARPVLRAGGGTGRPPQAGPSASGFGKGLCVRGTLWSF